MTKDILLEQQPKPWDNFELQRLPELKEEMNFFNFQAYAIYQSLLKDTYFLSLPTGTGKTLCSISSFLYYRTVYPNSRLLIVTTASALFQFADEFNKFFNHSLRIQVIHNKAENITASKYPKQRKEFISAWGDIKKPEAPEILLMNYAIFRIEKQTILKSVMSLKKQGFHTFFILDEATAFKALNTQISKAVAAITPVVNKKLGLTATLMKGKLDEIYGIFKNVGISLCSSKAVFEKNYCILWQHPTIWYLKRIKGFKNVELFKEKVDPYSLILRKSDIAADLPPFQIQKRFLELSTEQESLLKEIYSGALALTEEGFDYENIENNDSQKILEALTEVGYVKRALTSPQIVAPDRFYENSPKTDEILRMLKEEFVDEKIVIYTPSKKYLKILCETIRDCKDLDTYYRKPLEISGDVSADVRYQQMKDFSNNNIHNIMVLNNAGSEAINLQAASVLIITSLPDTWGQLIQIVGRISRIGSVHSSLLLVFLLHEDSQDFDEYCILQKQGVLFQAIHGDVEKGLLDTSVLRGAEHEGIPDEEFVSRSVAHLLIGTRKRRADKYSSSFVK
jgi:SNF2 family DNA or RNA helicase